MRSAVKWVKLDRLDINIREVHRLRASANRVLWTEEAAEAVEK
jgi:hypothetical protein